MQKLAKKHFLLAAEIVQVLTVAAAFLALSKFIGLIELIERSKMTTLLNIVSVTWPLVILSLIAWNGFGIWDRGRDFPRLSRKTYLIIHAIVTVLIITILVACSWTVYSVIQGRSIEKSTSVNFNTGSMFFT